MKSTFSPMNVEKWLKKKIKMRCNWLYYSRRNATGTVKGRSCTDGRKLREGYQNKYATSPTVALELVLITSVIDALKMRYVDVFNIPRELLTTYMYKYVIMVMQGILKELMVKTKPSIYRKFVTIENGRTVLYVKFQKELDGCLRSALLFYENLVLEMKSRGFIINP